MPLPIPGRDRSNLSPSQLHFHEEPHCWLTSLEPGARCELRNPSQVGNSPHLPIPEPQVWATGSRGESVGWGPHFCSHPPPWEYKGQVVRPRLRAPQLDTMKIPVLPAVALLSLLAFHSAQGASLSGSEVSTSPGLSCS